MKMGPNQNNKWNTIIIITTFMLIYQTNQVKTNEENDKLNLFNNLNLKLAKQFRDNIVDYIIKAQVQLKDVDDMVIAQIVNITGNDKLNENNYKYYVDQVKHFEKNLTEIALELQENNNASDNIYHIKNKSIALQNDMNTLKMDLDEDTLEGFIYLNHYYGNEAIMIRYESLTNRANQLLQNIFVQEQSHAEVNCINAINVKDFQLAEMHLNHIVDDERVSDIVKKTYSRNSKIFYSIIKFGEHISNFTRRFLIFNELNNNMRQNDDISFNKLYTLTEIFTENIVNHGTSDNTLTEVALNMVQLLKIEIKTIGIRELADILEEDDVQFSDVSFMDKIISLDRKLAENIFTESYQLSKSDSDTTQKFQEIFKILLQKKLNDSKKLFNYSLLIKQFFINIDQKELIDECLSIIKNIREFRFDTIKSILFSDQVCIFNIPEKVLSIEKDLDSSVYNITTNSPSSWRYEDIWVLNNTNDNVFEINSNQFGNYSIGLMNGNGHEVSAQEKGLEGNLWEFEPNEDYVYIKNLRNNEYLVATSEDNFNTGVFKNSSKYQWRTTECLECDEDIMTYIPGYGCVEILRWARVYNNMFIPPGAVQGGREINGARLYVGRAYHKGDVLPAKISIDRLSAYVSQDGKEFDEWNFEVLVSENVSWKPYKGGPFPKNTVVAGHTSNGDLFIGRARVNDNLTPGKVDPNYGLLYVPFDGAELLFTSFEILVVEKSSSK